MHVDTLAVGVVRDVLCRTTVLRLKRRSGTSHPAALWARTSRALRKGPPQVAQGVELSGRALDICVRSGWCSIGGCASLERDITTRTIQKNINYWLPPSLPLPKC